MRSIIHHSRAHLPACGWLAVMFAAVAIAGCGSSRDTSTASTSALQQAVGHTTATATAPRRSAATAHDQQAIAAGAAGKVASSSARSGGAREALSSGAALRSSSPKAGTGRHTSATADPSAPDIPAGPVLKTFSGTGDAALGMLSETTAIVLQWSTASPAIQIFTAQGFRLVSSPMSSGRVRLTRGKYPGLRIATKGPWKIQLRAVA